MGEGEFQEKPLEGSSQAESQAKAGFSEVKKG